MKMKNKLNNDKIYKYIKKEETRHSGIKRWKKKVLFLGIREPSKENGIKVQLFIMDFGTGGN